MTDAAARRMSAVRLRMQCMAVDGRSVPVQRPHQLHQSRCIALAGALPRTLDFGATPQLRCRVDRVHAGELGSHADGCVAEAIAARNSVADTSCDHEEVSRAMGQLAAPRAANWRVKKVLKRCIQEYNQTTQAQEGTKVKTPEEIAISLQGIYESDFGGKARGRFQISRGAFRRIAERTNLQTALVQLVIEEARELGLVLTELEEDFFVVEAAVMKTYRKVPLRVSSQFCSTETDK